MPKQVYIYGDSLLKATMPDEGYHYHFHYDEVLQRYPERRTQVVNRSKMGATISKGESLVQHDLDRGLEADYALVAYGGNDSDYDWVAIDADPAGNHHPRTELSAFREKLRHTVTMLREKGIQPVLMSLPPIDATRYLAFICRDGLRKERIMDWLGDDLPASGDVLRCGDPTGLCRRPAPDSGAGGVPQRPQADAAHRRRRHPFDHARL